MSEFGIRLSEWFERWFPDAFALALCAVGVVFVGALGMGSSPVQAAAWFGGGFWDLARFTLQMAMVLVTGYAVAVAPSVHRLIAAMARIPRDGRSAAAFVGLFSMLSSLLSWSFSLIFSGLLAREVLRRVKGADCRAVGAAAYLGLGSVWALGLSSSAALIMASAGSMPPALLKISGVLPFSQTLGLWQSALMAGVLVAVSAAIAYFSAPSEAQAKGPREMGVDYEPAAPEETRSSRPGEWLERSPLLTLLFAGLGGAYLASEAAAKGPGELLELNHYIFAFVVAGMLLHWRPGSYVKAIAAAVPSVAGILIQYPIYAGILKMMTESGLAAAMAHFFISISNRHTYPLLVGIYSAVLGLFVPSAGGKWLMEAPYLLEAAKSLQAHLGWVVQTYNAAEALPNLIHPFWMLPLLGILRLQARDIVGYCAVQFVFHAPIVLGLVWLLNYSLPFVPPLLP